MGTLMYVVEGPANGFTSIPVGVYWAITTMTTVGFGDITPKTDLGRLLASVMMLIGWGTLAVPTGIVSAEFTALRISREPTTRTCHECLSEGHLPEARFCRDCGAAAAAVAERSDRLTRRQPSGVNRPLAFGQARGPSRALVSGLAQPGRG